jgi:hypothetical protein
MFQREDWTLFRTLTTLGQKAGVPPARLARLVAKELADNALDAGGYCSVSPLEGANGFLVEDDGDGIPGDDAAVASLFSIRRPLTSSKLLRRPTRGALGNGLRVVAGAAMATGGSITVGTRGRTLRLTPQHDTGETAWERVGVFSGPGARVEVVLGAAVRVRPSDCAWARRAIDLQAGELYIGRTSPWWYDTESFRELLLAAGDRTVRDVMQDFDGCSRKAGEIAAPYRGRLARDLSLEEADALLGAARALAKQVNPKRLGFVGPDVDGFPSHYYRQTCSLEIPPARGQHAAILPTVVEAWSEIETGRPGFEVFVNRSPVTAEVTIRHEPKARQTAIFGCNLRTYVGGKTRHTHRVFLHVLTPYMPITTDGKEPDLEPLGELIDEVITRTFRRAKSAGAAGRPAEPLNIKGVTLANLAEAAAKASGGGRYRFSQRQLFYAVRPFLLDAFGQEPEYDYFCTILTEHEASSGDIPGMYRDPRGTLYHPHEKGDIPLGTLNVEEYRRPAWTFNKILYCEKEGFFPILRDVGWPERHDCALVSSKGFASRAARDVLDLLGDSGEEITFYCIHDADAYGTMIYQSLQEATGARPGRKVRIVNLGLEPDEARSMGLQVETVTRKGDRAAPVADYVKPPWRDWLQTHRVELNAMSTPQFLEWLDTKFANETGKVVPPASVLMDRLKDETRARLEKQIVAETLRAANVDERVNDAVTACAAAFEGLADTVGGQVRDALDREPELLWGEPVGRIAQAIAEGTPAVN